LLGRRGYRILREGRVPPRGERVFRRTRIQRGAKAKSVGCIHVFAGAPMLVLAIWGHCQAGPLAHRTEDQLPECASLTHGTLRTLPVAAQVERQAL
jgi:hypothetical protein